MAVFFFYLSACPDTMPMFKRLLLAVTVLSATLLSARILLKQDFDDTAVFKPGPLENGVAPTPLGGQWNIAKSVVDDFSIVTSPAASAPHAMKVLRQKAAGRAAFRFTPDEGYDFTLECKVCLTTGFGVAMHFSKDGTTSPYAGIWLQANQLPAGYNVEMGWLPEKTLPVLPVEQWLTIRIAFDYTNHCYRLAVVIDGEERAGDVEYPVLADGVCNEIRFLNILPELCHSYIDDVVVTQADTPALAGRKLLNELASSPEVSLQQLLAEKPGTQCRVEAGRPAVIEFAPEAQVNALILGAIAPLPPVTVKALNLMGQWVELGKELKADSNGFLIVPPTQKVTKLTLEFAAATTLTACKVYSSLGAGQGALDKEFAAKLDAEYRLPVYDMQYKGHDRAQFTMVNHTDAVLPVVVALKERATGVDCGRRDVQVPPGRSDIYYELKDMPNGEYVTTVIDNSDPDAPRRGTFERLLRVRTSPECTAIPWKEVTGQKIFFPDGFYLDECQNVDFVPGVAERHCAVRGVPGDDEKFIVCADNIFIDTDGRIRINYHTMNRMWQIASTRHFNAVAVDDTLEKWEVFDGTAPVPPQQRPMDSKLPPAATPDWAKKPGPDGKITYRFYDAVKDGPVKLNQVNLESTSYAAPGTAGYQNYDWGVMRPAACTIWPVWYKSPGEAIILSRTALVESFPVSGTLEPPNSGSDLGFGQWLSDDGKTLYRGHGRHLMRFPPYTARYDNIHDRARIVAVWRTTDGLNWEQNYIAPPSDNKPLADQSYGGKHFTVPDGAGLRIAFFNRYSAFTQQISWEIIYSWDNFRWTRYQDKPQFLPNGPLGDFFHGGGYVNTAAVERGGKFYQLMYWVGDGYHFEGEITHSSTLDVAGITAQNMERRYKPRHLEEWPFFQEYFGGSWEKLAEHARNTTTGFGVAVYRKDGYFSANAGADTARMVTKPFVATGGLKVNAAVRDGGFIKIRLLQGGKPVKDSEKELKECDEVAMSVFDQLPDGEFQIELTMKEASLYTLQF